MLIWWIPLPLASFCPRKSLVPCCVQLIVTNLWLYGQPRVARSIGGLWWSCLSDSMVWMEQFPNHTSWIDYQPHYRFTVPFFHSFTYLCFPALSSLWSGPPLLHLFLCLCSSHDFLFKHIFFRVLNNPWMAFSKAIFCHPSYRLLAKVSGIPFPLLLSLVSGTVSIRFGFINHFVSLWFPAPLTVLLK